MKKNLLFSLLAVAALLAGCALPPAAPAPVTAASGIPQKSIQPATPVPASATPTLTRTATPTAGLDSILPACGLAPIAVPTMAVYPGVNALDRSTGLHMTGHPVSVDLSGYRLRVTGLVDHPLSLTYDNLRCMPRVTAKLDLECIGFFTDTTTWSGVPLKHILDLAGLQSGAKYLSLVAADGYESQLDIRIALKNASFLAYEWKGQPLPVLHGFPLRAVFPGLPGSQWVKWLVEIRVEGG